MNFNWKLYEALDSGEYPCPECGRLMIFENEIDRDILVCEACGYSVYIDDYGLTEDELAGMYPTKEELLGHDEDGEDSDEWNGEHYDPERDEP